MNKLTRAAAAALLACAVALPATATATAAPASPRTATTTLDRPAEHMRLPTPTGPYGVGSSVLHLVDHFRTDPWVPEADGRELMVTLHYPASGRHTPGRPAPYATQEEARLLLTGVQVEDPASVRQVARARTHSAVDARPAPGRHPLVVLSPGFGMPRFTLTSLAVDLASRGYVVASLDHAYESSGTSVPGGRTLTCVACTVMEEDDWAKGHLVTGARAADTRFVLDRLTGPRPAWRYASSIDRTRIGMAGHSVGGASAVSAMATDRRIDAGVNMDGTFWDTLPADGLGRRPFLLLGTDEFHRPGGEDTSWDTTWAALRGEKHWLTVDGADHLGFSDAPVLLGHFGLPGGDLAADRAVTVTRAYVAAFFDEHLRGRDQPLLDGPDPAHPEVRFHRP
ncbi:alpha/beta hydrolase family protein [Streptomyces lancefieldiae]|uniref:Alpha/beta hydrolase n=1 Tax=Streptomyces lancefieldiae TaxID=3075520 RepID=A0ABU3B0G4_9ACTN|nr:alpha/beta hydrolase [Streptomyces sp. DSM 40712]MDT0615938.1 alpha/beta hydrolase [Streptomyces sp. DSM 40712]